MRRTPYFSEFDDLFERMTRGLEQHHGGREVAVDVAETDGSVVVTADLPGYDRDDIHLSVAGGVLTVRAERDHVVDDGDGAYVRRERRHESVRRTVELPAEVDEQAAGATYTNGVLEVTLPTVEGSDGGHEIDVN